MGDRHPRHLRGKEIGLWYAKRKKLENEENKGPPKCLLGKIELSQDKIQSIINHVQAGEELATELSQDDERYQHFRAMFDRNVTGSIQEKMERMTCKLKRNESLDERFYNELMEQLDNSRYRKMLEGRKKLPAYGMKDEIIKLIESNSVCVISGDTGCGKTTQVAQFVLEHHILEKKGSICKIMVTQPRRISAISVAERVSDERNEKLGQSTGYQIRLESVLPRETGSITFCTTGIILKRMEDDPCLSNVSHLILDEIHERDVMSDFIMALMKQVFAYRPDLKIILMSATLNSEQFAKYFHDCAMLKIPGFTYPVEEFFLEDVLEKTGYEFGAPLKHMKWNKTEYNNFIDPYIRNIEAKKTYSKKVCKQLRNPASEIIDLDLIEKLIFYICNTDKENGAILIFLPGYINISALYNQLTKKMPDSRYIIIPLHSQLPSVEQRQIFNRPPPGKRKIIIATNIAETSITIDDVVFVIDAGRIKYQNCDSENNVVSLNAHWVSCANAQQRKGRAGRVQAGVCYHLFTKIRYEMMDKYLKPEILRTRLENVILQIKILQLGKAEDFLKSLLDVPDDALINLSMDILKRINAINEEEILTPLGYHLARLPIAPQMGKMLLMGAIFGCLDPILSIASCLDFKDPFILPLGKEGIVNRIRLQFADGEKSDHLILAEVLRQYEQTRNRRQFCWENFLSQNTLNMLLNMKKQFMDYLYSMNFVPDTDSKNPCVNINADNRALIKSVLVAGLFPNIVMVRKKHMKIMENGHRVKAHPKSILSMHNYFDQNIIVYYHKLKSSQDYFHDGTMVNNLPVLFFADVCNYDSEKQWLSISDRAAFKCKPQMSEMINLLRKRLNWFLEYKAAKPGIVNWSDSSYESQLLQPVVDLINCEEMGEMYDSDYADV